MKFSAELRTSLDAVEPAKRRRDAAWEPGSMDNLQVVVADADETYADLTERGSEVQGVDERARGRWALQELPDYSVHPD